MKKYISLLLSITMVLLLVACNNEKVEQTATQPETRPIILPTKPPVETTEPDLWPEEIPEDEEFQDEFGDEDTPGSSSGSTPGNSGSSGNSSGGSSSGGSAQVIKPVFQPTKYDNIVADPHTWYRKFQDLPIASSSMSTDELRQLCVDYFRLQLSFTWTPNKDISYTIVSKNRKVSLPTGIAYSGMCYAAGHASHGAGNIYKMLSYYDPDTGVLDVASMGDNDNMLGIIGSHCSWGTCWGWNRVSNSIALYTMSDYKPSNGALLVGPYTYDESQADFSKTDTTTKIIQSNGEEVIFESYAQMLLGDGLYSSPAWHVMMCSISPVVVRNPDGTVNPDQSYLHVCEQITDGTSGWWEPIKQSNGISLRELGGVDIKLTFRELLKRGYIPFTIPEFVGKDPVEKGKAWVGGASSPYKNGKDITLAKLSGTKLRANYVISNVWIQVSDASGNVLLSYDTDVYTRNRTYTLEISKFLDADKLSSYANGENTIHIFAQLSNGQMIEAFNTKLKTA